MTRSAMWRALPVSTTPPRSTCHVGALLYNGYTDCRLTVVYLNHGWFTPTRYGSWGSNLPFLGDIHPIVLFCQHRCNVIGGIVCYNDNRARVYQIKPDCPLVHRSSYSISTFDLLPCKSISATKPHTKIRALAARAGRLVSALSGHAWLALQE